MPTDLYHRYVEFKPFVKAMFTAKGFRGFLLSKALHHQHARVYNFDRSTLYGLFPSPSKDMAVKFLDLVHFDQGGRIFTYVLTLDALFRFTETGKEFGIDLLSKHTMHSDVNLYIAFSGEFFIRRLKHPHRPDRDHEDSERDGKGRLPHEAETHPPNDLSDGPPKDDPPKDPAYYELIIDNDSGTYRPNAALLPQLKSFFEHQFPGLKVTTLDSQKDADRMKKMKNEQREKKKSEGDRIVFTQGSRSSSVSSSDEEDLQDRIDALQESRTNTDNTNAGTDAGPGHGGGRMHDFKSDAGLLKHDASARQSTKAQKWKRNAFGGGRDGGDDAREGEEGGPPPPPPKGPIPATPQS